MKSYCKILAATLLLTGFLFKVQAQTIWVANNNPGATGGTHVYTGAAALDTCIVKASPGDIIHVIPSSISYGTITVNKTLSIYGIGTNPVKEGTKTSIVDYLYIGASNCVVSGLQINTYFDIGSANSQVINGLLVENCYISYSILLYNTSVQVGNLTIHSNIFNGNNGYYRINLANNSSSNVSITNNIIMVDNSTYGAISMNGGAVITNNTFISNGGSNSYAFNNLDGCVIKNNIFFGTKPFGYTSTTNNTYTKNMTFGAANNSMPVGINGNIGDTSLVSINPQLTNIPGNPLTWSFSFDPHPKGGISPAINAGDDGTDLGVTGGAIPFNFAGTNIPLIQSVSIPSVIIQGNTLPTTIKAKGN